MTNKTTRILLAALVVAGGAVVLWALAQREVASYPSRTTSLGVTGFVTGITARSRTIFQAGQQHGNLRHAFSVVGDSISVDPRFLRPFADDAYDLGQYTGLADTITFFSEPDGRGANPYTVPTVAARVGWMTENVLDPGLANPARCRGGETPLACELRLARPTVAIIMLGTNDLAGGRSLETYRNNLHQIVQLIVDNGTIPLLSTIPPLPISGTLNDRVGDFNAVIRQTAHDFDTPLVDYWSALQSAPSFGISDDGVHPNAPPDGRSAVFDTAHLAYGTTIRNWITLDALDQLRRRVLE